MTTMRTRALSLLAAGAVLAGPVAFATSAQAHGKEHQPRCTISAADRAAALDRLQVINRQMAGHHLTKTEKEALHSAIEEMYTAAKDAKMSSAVRAAKKAELKSLEAQLESATTPEVRDAVRAEISAIREELDAARLTRTEREALHAKAKEMAAALRGKPTKAEKDALRAEARELVKKLGCKVI